MEKKTAEKIANAIRLFEKPVNLLTEISSEIENEDERKKVRKYVAEIMALSSIDLLNLVVDEHPELDPYKEK